MNIIIVGGGKVGAEITAALAKEGHDIVVLDTDPDVVKKLTDDYDVMGVCGSGVICANLIEAGAENARLIISTTSQDEINLLCCIIAKKLGARHSIARVRNPELVDQLPFMQSELGISTLVNPDFYAASEIAQVLQIPSAIKIDTFAKGRLLLAELKVDAGGKLDGMALHMLRRTFGAKILVCAVSRKDEIYIPGGNFVLEQDDHIYITASHPELLAFLNAAGYASGRIRNAMIVGGSRIAFYLAQQLIETGVSVKIIEIDHDRCVELSRILTRATIVCGDGTSEGLLVEEGVGHTDACVTLTGTDEENIIISMFAKSCGARKVITKVNKTSLQSMMTSVGLDTSVSPKTITANIILQYVRAKMNSKGSNIQTLYKLVGDRVEALEFVAGEQSKTVGVPLRDLKIKQGVLISGIIRKNKVIIPSGTDLIEPHDRVIVVTTNRYFTDLDEILE